MAFGKKKAGHAPDFSVPTVRRFFFASQRRFFPAPFSAPPPTAPPPSSGVAVGDVAENQNAPF
jgi:hypothetical protein